MSEPSEQPKRRRRQPAPPPPPAQGSVAKGAILVAVALVIGVVLLRDDDASVAQVAVGNDDTTIVDDDAATDTDTDTGDDVDSTTTTTVALRPPSEVKVLVANGSSAAGVAGAQTDALQALGYVTGTPTNADDRVPATVVYHTVGYEAEAAVLAESLGIGPNAITPLPTPAPVDDMELSNILVVVGPDLAGGA